MGARLGQPLNYQELELRKKACYQAIKSNPSFLSAYTNLANINTIQGNIEASVRAHAKHLEMSNCAASFKDSQEARKPILVTGSHRSGSTWVGRMLALSPSVFYIHEPFNIDDITNPFNANFDFSLQYIPQDNDNSGLYLKSLHRLVTAIMTSRNATPPIRALVKDPIAIFSAEWLAKVFDMDVIVLIRHPAAFALSLKSKNWKYDFSHILKQPLLLKHYLSPFQSQIYDYTIKEYDIIDQAILLWNLIYFIVNKYREFHKNWIFVRHEDLSKRPIQGFNKIFQKLDMPLSNSIQSEILEYCCKDKSESEIKRNSLKNLGKWKQQLTPVEINRIKKGTNAISNKFYSDYEW